MQKGEPLAKETGQALQATTMAEVLKTQRVPVGEEKLLVLEAEDLSISLNHPREELE